MNKVRCRHCKTYFNRELGVKTNAAWFCSFDHAIEYGQSKAASIHAKLQKQDLVKRKAELKPISKLLSETQAVVNKYVRLRDHHKGCVSCDKPATWIGQWHASHFHSRGASSYLRFNLWNIHKSCSICNNHLSGNIGEYQPELIRRIGQDKFDYLEQYKATPKKYTIDYLQRLKRIFNKKCRMLEKRLEHKRAA